MGRCPVVCEQHPSRAALWKGHPAPRLNFPVSVCDDGDDVFATANNTVTTDTHRHASLEILFRVILRPACVRLLS